MNFNAREARSRIVLWIRDWFNVNGEDSTAIIGISGGKDSTIATALLVEALGEDRVFGILMPQDVQSDISDSKLVVSALNIESAEINIGQIYRECYAATDGYFAPSYKACLNLPPRIRTLMLYFYAASMNGRVCNTSNHSERMAGYFTRFGDECGDFSLFHDLSAAEVIAIGDTYVKDGILFEELVHKAPADGLTGVTDEEKLGFTYDELEEFVADIETNGDDSDRMDEKAAKMRKAYYGNAFKRNTVNLPHPAYGDLIS